MAALRANAFSVRPWLQSTGPQSDQGKAKSKMNALHHGLRSAQAVSERREAADVFRKLREYFDQMTGEE
jgi:hypothetical protein